MTEMRQFAPSKIYATVNGSSTQLPSGAKHWVGGWSEDGSNDRSVEYIRSDNHHTATEALIASLHYVATQWPETSAGKHARAALKAHKDISA